MVDGMSNNSECPQGVGRAVTGVCAPTATLMQLARSKSLLLLSAAGLFLSVSSFAEELVDPTRPPASIAAPVAEAVVQAAGLQSIIISRNRRAAIIDGQTVELGDRLGDARLIEVNAAGVVLKSNKGRQVLMLFPDVKITRAQVTPVRNHKPVTSGEKK